MISDFTRERRFTAFANVPVNAPYKSARICSLKWPGKAMRHHRTTIAWFVISGSIYRNIFQYRASRRDREGRVEWPVSLENVTLGFEFDETNPSFGWSWDAIESSCIIPTSTHMPYHIQRMWLCSHALFEVNVFDQETGVEYDQYVISRLVSITLLLGSLEVFDSWMGSPNTIQHCCLVKVRVRKEASRASRGFIGKTPLPPIVDWMKLVSLQSPTPDRDIKESGRPTE